eukprot:CAMPEP_0118980726 /NCGR_PEP_ID=MMETSP1173-20130426/28990_1 /TAXON_ID=1034831 /ORGANISM="Rhizochromulina marina cf, Strain CCMP1243" /LENGTH=450 /DNA_ID=CAMNT_0006931091 /DNA_START=72 /DNA_END=1420 /DNA_ORIENTATION=-
MPRSPDAIAAGNVHRPAASVELGGRTGFQRGVGALPAYIPITSTNSPFLPSADPILGKKLSLEASKADARELHAQRRILTRRAERAQALLRRKAEREATETYCGVPSASPVTDARRILETHVSHEEETFRALLSSTGAAPALERLFKEIRHLATTLPCLFPDMAAVDKETLRQGLEVAGIHLGEGPDAAPEQHNAEDEDEFTQLDLSDVGCLFSLLDPKDQGYILIEDLQFALRRFHRHIAREGEATRQKSQSQVLGTSGSRGLASTARSPSPDGTGSLPVACMLTRSSIQRLQEESALSSPMGVIAPTQTFSFSRTSTARTSTSTLFRTGTLPDVDQRTGTLSSSPSIPPRPSTSPSLPSTTALSRRPLSSAQASTFASSIPCSGQQLLLTGRPRTSPSYGSSSMAPLPSHLSPHSVWDSQSLRAQQQQVRANHEHELHQRRRVVQRRS